MGKRRVRLLLIAVALAALFHAGSRTTVGKAWGDALLLFFMPGGRDTISALSPSEELAEAHARIAELEKENETLRSIGYIEPFIASPKILARVLWYDPAPLVERMRIGAGENEGVGEGAAVLAPGGALVGRIIEVRPRTAVVEAVSSPSFGALSVSVGEAVGVARATAAGNFILQFVGDEDLPASGTEVRTAGLGDKLPQGLLLGYVAEAEETPKDPFARVIATPAASFEGLSHVVVHAAAP